MDMCALTLLVYQVLETMSGLNMPCLLIDVNSNLQLASKQEIS